MKLVNNDCFKILTKPYVFFCAIITELRQVTNIHTLNIISLRWFAQICLAVALQD